MTIEERLASLFAEIQREIRRNPDFAERIAKALDLDAGRPEESGRPHRRSPGVLDPFAVIQQGEEALKARLAGLDVEQLKDIIAEHGMDRTKLAMKWKTKDRLISLIVSTVASRARKGDAFREPPKPL
jgi:hypothetical protein